MNVQSFIGRTPLVELKTFDVPAGVRIFAKAEFMNPGAASKTGSSTTSSMTPSAAVCSSPARP